MSDAWGASWGSPSAWALSWRATEARLAPAMLCLVDPLPFALMEFGDALPFVAIEIDDASSGCES